MQFAIVECRLCFSAFFFLPFAVVFPARTLLCLYKQWLEGRKGGGIYDATPPFGCIFLAGMLFPLVAVVFRAHFAK